MSDTEADLAGLRAVAEAATPGPWGVARFFWKIGSARGLEDGWWQEITNGGDTVCLIQEADPEPDSDLNHIATFDPPTVLGLLDRLEAAEAKVARVEALFAGGPDTPCRTTWRPAFGGQREECVEVPMFDLRAALADPGDERGQ